MENTKIIEDQLTILLNEAGLNANVLQFLNNYQPADDKGFISERIFNFATEFSNQQVDIATVSLQEKIKNLERELSIAWDLEEDLRYANQQIGDLNELLVDSERKYHKLQEKNIESIMKIFKKLFCNHIYFQTFKEIFKKDKNNSIHPAITYKSILVCEKCGKIMSF